MSWVVRQVTGFVGRRQASLEGFPESVSLFVRTPDSDSPLQRTRPPIPPEEVPIGGERMSLTIEKGTEPPWCAADALAEGLGSRWA
jgi:hypothetical protein